MNISRSPYELSVAELEMAKIEAKEFASNIQPWIIPNGNGTYRQKRPGLGIVIKRYIVDCISEPHKMYCDYDIYAWRTSGESLFGESVGLKYRNIP